jgi:hypothetical protein
MQKFAFVIHPIDVRRDMARKYPVALFAPEPLIAAILPRIKPKIVSHITGVKSEQPNTETEGWFIVCPLTRSSF